MISIHNILHHGEYQNTLSRWEKEARSVKKEQMQEDENFKKNIEKEKEASRASLKTIEPRENETIIKIDDFIFTTNHNIESLNTELDLNINTIKTMDKNIYLALGAPEERISFEATIFIEQLAHFKDLKEKIKKRELLSLSSLESVGTKKILITNFSSRTNNWLIDSNRNATFFTRSFSISGVVFD